MEVQESINEVEWSIQRQREADPYYLYILTTGGCEDNLNVLLE